MTEARGAIQGPDFPGRAAMQWRRDFVEKMVQRTPAVVAGRDEDKSTWRKH
jgi:hypothetical protein